MDISKHCLGALPLTADQAQKIYDVAHVSSKESLIGLIKKLCLSHERLRAERDGLQVMYDQLDRKVLHGCTDANCNLCDAKQSEKDLQNGIRSRKDGWG